MGSPTPHRSNHQFNIYLFRQSTTTETISTVPSPPSRTARTKSDSTNRFLLPRRLLEIRLALLHARLDRRPARLPVGRADLPVPLEELEGVQHPERLVHAPAERQ